MIEQKVYVMAKVYGEGKLMMSWQPGRRGKEKEGAWAPVSPSRTCLQ
jgi:hypothetical protein